MAFLHSSKDFRVNDNGGIYVRGERYSLQTKLSVLEAYVKLGETATVRAVAKVAKVGRNFPTK